MPVGFPLANVSSGQAQSAQDLLQQASVALEQGDATTAQTLIAQLPPLLTAAEAGTSAKARAEQMLKLREVLASLTVRAIEQRDDAARRLVGMRQKRQALAQYQATADVRV